MANSSNIGNAPIIYAGFPASAWWFAIRTWLTFVVALYVSFWLQLDSPSSSAFTVAILANAARGQVSHKAMYRLLGTVIGAAASICIVGLFAQAPVLLLSAVSIWIGVCAYATALLDGNRAYGSTLAAVTVAIIVLENLDAPQAVFEAATARGAAIVVGILTIMVINDVLATPDFYPQVVTRIEQARVKVRAYVQKVASGEALPITLIAGLLRDVCALRSDIDTIAIETNLGSVRSAAARAAMVNLTVELAAGHALQGRPQGEAAEQLATQIIGKRMEAEQDLVALRSGHRPPRNWGAPVARSHDIALMNGGTAALYFAMGAILLAICGWPATEASLTLLAVLISLLAFVPDARSYMRMAVIACPVSCVLAGILEFVVLDGVSAFPLLAIALAPFTVGLALLITLPNPSLASFGRTTLVFTMVLFLPTNPQSYDPQAFLFRCLFLCLAAFVLFALQMIIPPLSSSYRARYLLKAARRDLELQRSDLERLPPEEATFRDAVRIGEIMNTGTGDADLAKALSYLRWVTYLRFCHERGKL